VTLEGGKRYRHRPSCSHELSAEEWQSLPVMHMTDQRGEINALVDWRVCPYCGTPIKLSSLNPVTTWRDWKVWAFMLGAAILGVVVVVAVVNGVHCMRHPGDPSCVVPRNPAME